MFFYVLFGVAPAIGTIFLSITDYSGNIGTGSNQFTGLENYINLFVYQQPALMEGLITTIVFVVGVTVIQNIISLGLAQHLMGKGRREALLRALIFLPIVLGVTVVGLIWLLTFDPSSGPAAKVLGIFGVHSAFFGSSDLALWLVIGAQVWQNLGFAMLVFIGGLRSISKEFYEAASLDGASSWVRLRSVTLPLLAPSITANVLLSTVGSFITYNIIYVLTNGSNYTNTFGMQAFTAAFGGASNLGYGAAITVVLFGATLVVALPLFWYLRRREERVTA